MTTFGDALRKFRQASNDPDRLDRRLTQERLGELIGEELGNLFPEYYSTLLHPVLGLVVILSALIGVVLMARRISK